MRIKLLATLLISALVLTAGPVATHFVGFLAFRAMMPANGSTPASNDSIPDGSGTGAVVILNDAPQSSQWLSK